MLENDHVRSESYKAVKKIMDRYHAWFINESLKDFSFSDELINKYYELSLKKRSDEENGSFDEIKKSMRQSIVINGFEKRSDIFSKLFKKDVIKLLVDFVGDALNDEKDIALTHIEKFKSSQRILQDFLRIERMYTQRTRNIPALHIDPCMRTCHYF